MMQTTLVGGATEPPVHGVRWGSKHVRTTLSLVVASAARLSLWPSSFVSCGRRVLLLHCCMLYNDFFPPLDERT